jgi:uncharacterized protein YegP (UPF0339 family)
MRNFNGHILYTAPDGKWRVAVLLKNNQTAITDPSKYASQASATLAALAAKHAKPFMDFIVVGV